MLIKARCGKHMVIKHFKYSPDKRNTLKYEVTEGINRKFGVN